MTTTILTPSATTSASFPASRPRPINVAVIGCGYWGPNLIRNFSTTPGANLMAICDLQPERLAKFKAQYPTVETTSDYAALLANPELDAVAIAT